MLGRRVACLTAVAGMLPSAFAQQSLEAVFVAEVAPAGSASFGEFVAIAPGQAVDVRISVRYTRGVALASALYNIRGDSLTGSLFTATGQRRVAPFNFGTQTLAVFPNASGFRIDDARDTTDLVTLGLSAAQRPPQIGQPANISNPAEVFRFTVTAPFDLGMCHIRVPWEQIRNSTVNVFTNPLDPAVMPLTAVGVDGAWIYVGGNPCQGQQVSTPASRRVIAGGDLSLATTGDGPTWQWYKGGSELFDSARLRGAEAATLNLLDVTPADSGDYVLFTLCSHTDVVRVDVFCRADFNNDGFIDFFDYTAYVDCFESGECPGSLPQRVADYNGDGFADFFDYADFVDSFERGDC